MPIHVVLFDACVLYPASLRDVLMYLAGSGLFQAKWTDRIHDEWITNLLKRRGGTFNNQASTGASQESSQDC